MDAEILTMAVYGVANATPRRGTDTVYFGEGRKVVLHVRSDSDAPPARVWLRDTASARVLDMSTTYSENGVSACSSWTAPPCNRDAPMR